KRHEKITSNCASGRWIRFCNGTELKRRCISRDRPGLSGRIPLSVLRLSVSVLRLLPAISLHWAVILLVSRPSRLLFAFLPALSPLALRHRRYISKAARFVSVTLIFSVS